MVKKIADENIAEGKVSVSNDINYHLCILTH